MPPRRFGLPLNSHLRPASGEAAFDPAPPERNQALLSVWAIELHRLAASVACCILQNLLSHKHRAFRSFAERQMPPFHRSLHWPMGRFWKRRVRFQSFRGRSNVQRWQLQPEPFDQPGSTARRSLPNAKATISTGSYHCWNGTGIGGTDCDRLNGTSMTHQAAYFLTHP